MTNDKCPLCENILEENEDEYCDECVESSEDFEAQQVPEDY